MKTQILRLDRCLMDTLLQRIARAFLQHSAERVRVLAEAPSRGNRERGNRREASRGEAEAVRKEHGR
jgi:hypothetical protein